MFVLYLNKKLLIVVKKVRVYINWGVFWICFWVLLFCMFEDCLGFGLGINGCFLVMLSVLNLMMLLLVFVDIDNILLMIMIDRMLL